MRTKKTTTWLWCIELICCTLDDWFNGTARHTLTHTRANARTHTHTEHIAQDGSFCHRIKCSSVTYSNSERNIARQSVGATNSYTNVYNVAKLSAPCSVTNGKKNCRRKLTSENLHRNAVSHSIFCIVFCFSRVIYRLRCRTPIYCFRRKCQVMNAALFPSSPRDLVLLGVLIGDLRNLF